MSAPAISAVSHRQRRSGAEGPGLDGTVLVVIAVAALAWTVLALRGHEHTLGELPNAVVPPDPGVPHGGHQGHGASGASGGLVVQGLALGLVAITGWALMVVAMMLPPALPLFRTVRTLVSRRSNPGRLTALAAITFVLVWTGVGAVLIAGDFGVRALWTQLGWSTRPHTVTGIALIVAGLYQFSPLKNSCLRGCRSPRSFALAHWHGHRSAGAEMTTLSGAYALSCVGCCWALMLVCFAVGTAALPVMVALSILMAAERLVPWGRRLVGPAGLLLTALGVAVLALPHLVAL